MWLPKSKAMEGHQNTELKIEGLKKGRGDFLPERSERPEILDFRETEAEEMQACGHHPRWARLCSQSRGWGQRQSRAERQTNQAAACVQSLHLDFGFTLGDTHVWQAHCFWRKDTGVSQGKCPQTSGLWMDGTGIKTRSYLGRDESGLGLNAIV